jgi:hypothetical protein
MGARNMKSAVAIVCLILFGTANAADTCTDFVKIKELLPRSGGWIHIIAQGAPNMDISRCGINNYVGMLLNFSDSSGTDPGKKAMLSILLTAYASGKAMKLCSSGCDSQFPNYSRLDFINGIE